MSCKMDMIGQQCRYMLTEILERATNKQLLVIKQRCNPIAVQKLAA